MVNGKCAKGKGQRARGIGERLPFPLCPLPYALPARCVVIENDIAERFYANVEAAVVNIKIGRVMWRSLKGILSLWHTANLEEERRGLPAIKRKILGAGNPISLPHAFFSR